MTRAGRRSGWLVRLARVLAGLCLLLGVAAAVGAWAFFGWVERTIDPELEGLDQFRPPSSVVVLDADGTEIDRFHVERRVWVDLDEMTPAAWQAVVAAEDRRFLDHPGVDVWGIFRALVVNLQAGEVKEGGSTLTQQLVKNLVVGNERSVWRKLREAIMAWRLERRVDKRRILEFYLNYVYLGSGNYGMEAAAQDYFGVSSRELDAGQAALLAGLIPSPTALSPRRNPDRAAERRALVLDAMVAEEFITAEQAAGFNAVPVDPPLRTTTGVTGPGVAYLTAVRREVRRLLGQELPYSMGLQVNTPYDARIQAVAEEALDAAARRVMARQGVQGVERNLDPAEWPDFYDRAEGFARGPDGRELPLEPGACFPALVVERGQPLRASQGSWWLERGDWWRKVRNPDPEEAARSLWEVVEPGDVVSVCLVEDTRVRLDDRPWVRGAAVVLENATGGVVALASGSDTVLEGFNRATQARRQPGSSFKPYVYVTAVEQGATQLDEVNDAPIEFRGAGGAVWRPQNYGRSFRGRVPMRDALAASLNTVAVRLALEVTPRRIAETAQELGIRTPLRTDLTLALGSSEVTVMEHAVAVCGLARMGRTTEPVFLASLRGQDGRALGVAGETLHLVDRDGEPVEVRLPGGPGVQAVPPEAAWQVVDMMMGVVLSGTGREARVKHQDRMGKTGTTSAYVDAWFVGATPSHTVVVWIGTDTRSTLGSGETGGRAALPVWIALANALPAVPDRFRPPDGVALVPWRGRLVGLPRDHMPDDALERSEPPEGPLPAFP